MKNIFEKIKKESHKQTLKILNNSVKRSKENPLYTLKSCKFSFQISNIASAIIFTICFSLIGFLINYLIKTDSFSILYQITLFFVSLFFLQISGFIFLAHTYSIEKISQLIENFQQHNN